MAGSRYRVVSLATAPHAERSGVLIPIGAGDFSHRKNHQDLWGAHSANYLVGTRRQAAGACS